MSSRRPPPPEKGNQRGLTHGAYAQLAPLRLDDKARHVFDALAADAPVRGPDGGLPPADAVAVRMLADVLCRLEDLNAWIAEQGIVNTRRYDSDNRKTRRQANRKAKAGRKRKRMDPLRVVALEDRLWGRAQSLMEQLGMTPRSRAKLGLDMVRATDLATAMSEENPQRRAELLREAGVIDVESTDA